jgi:hypothetical protein
VKAVRTDILHKLRSEVETWLNSELLAKKCGKRAF